MISPALRSDLAPTGKLRVGINYGNPVLATREPLTGELRGVAPELARELGRRAGLPVELVGFEAAGKMTDAIKSGAWDIAFLAVDPVRAGEIDFTAPYIEIEGVYLVPPGSPIRAIAEVDREGVRIGVSANSAYDLFLKRNLQHAQLVHASSPEASLSLFGTDKIDVLAGVKQPLVAHAAKVPGARVLDGRFMAIHQALGVVKGRGSAVTYLREFIEEVKASGFVAQAIENAGIRGVSVAPRAPIS